MFRFRLILFFLLTAGTETCLSDVPLAEAVSADGNCRAVLSAVPDQPALADILTLTIDVMGPDETEVVFPPFGENLGELKIVDIQTEDRRLVISAVPRHSGKTPIWPIVIQCGKQRIELPAAELSISTTVDGKTASLDDIGLDTEPMQVQRWYVYAITALFVLGMLIVLWMMFKRKKSDTGGSKTAPSVKELALRRLAELLESRKHESNVKGFFVELSDIVRWYIERLTGLRTPELTTEEFLNRIARPNRQAWGESSNSATGTISGVLDNEALELLVPFLESADIVKFAKHIPAGDEVMAAFRRAEHFIQHHVEVHSDSDYFPDERVRLQNGGKIG